MTHMQFATWVREHREDITTWTFYSVGNFKGFARFPVLLNLGLNRTGLVFRVNVSSHIRNTRERLKNLAHSIAQKAPKSEFYRLKMDAKLKLRSKRQIHSFET